MNYYFKKVLLGSLLILGFGLLAAQQRGSFNQDISIEDCDLPAPVNLTVEESGTQHFDLSWDPVTGATAYRVVVTDTGTGIVEINDYAYATTYIAGPLTPGREYSIQVAAVCGNGMDGNYSDEVIRIAGVIIVDIVIRFSEDGCNKHTATHIEDLGNGWKKHYYSIATDESINVSRTNTNGGSFNIIIKQVNGVPSALIGYYGPQDPGIELSPAPGKKTLSHNGNPLIKLDIVSHTNLIGNYVALEVYNNLGVIVEKCLNVGFDSENRVGRMSPPLQQGNPSDFEQITLAPNPTKGLVNIKVPQDARLEIFDVNGRLWYSKDVSPDSLTIDASQWPSGTYFVRTIKNNIPTTTRFVKS